MKDFMQMFGQLKEAQTKIQEIQQKLGGLQATGEAGAGLVKATVNGHKKLIRLAIDASIIQPDEQNLLQDLIIAAVNVAMQKIEEQIKAHLQATTTGILGNLPIDFLV
jgi:DNA-binding YbaB/EbfC family protein